MSAYKKTIVIFNPWDRLIGPNRYLAEIFALLPEIAKQTVIITDELRDSLSEYEEMGCRVEVWPETKLLNTEFSLANILRLLWWHAKNVIGIARRLKRLRPALIISNTENIWIGGLAARLLWVPHVQIFHALSFHERFKQKKLLKRIYILWLQLLATQFVAVSNEVKRLLCAGGVKHEKITVVRNAISKRYCGLANKFTLKEILGDLSAKRPLILSAGRISAMKEIGRASCRERV